MEWMEINDTKKTYFNFLIQNPATFLVVVAVPMPSRRTRRFKSMCTISTSINYLFTGKEINRVKKVLVEERAI